MEALSELSASQLGSPNPKPNPFSSVQVASPAAQVDINWNQIANNGSEMVTKNDNQNNELQSISSGENTLIGKETTSQSLLCKEPDSSLLTQQSQITGESQTNNGTNTIRKRTEISMEGTEMEHKKSKTQTTPTFRNALMIAAREPTLHYKESKSFKTTFSQPTAKSP